MTRKKNGPMTNHYFGMLQAGKTKGDKAAATRSGEYEARQGQRTGDKGRESLDWFVVVRNSYPLRGDCVKQTSHISCARW